MPLRAMTELVFVYQLTPGSRRARSELGNQVVF
jgi:hypothetical protein